MPYTKHNGQVFTPQYIVEMMLDFCGYKGANILCKHLMDNSCGDGAFLCSSVTRYCDSFLKLSDDKKLLKIELETFIHGIELDSAAYDKCLLNLGKIMDKYGIDDIHWDIVNCDALATTNFDKKMDYVVGNHPYVNVHNLGTIYDEVKKFSFASGGMTNLYLVFYEIGFNMLSKNGKLCYITPSSWLDSIAATNMRKFILQKRNIVGVIDLCHFQAFEKITAYTMVSLFDNSVMSNCFDYITYDGKKKQYVDKLSYDEININNCFYLSSKPMLKKLYEIKNGDYKKYAVVKNGFATLSDNIFIGSFSFTDCVIPVIKASNGKWNSCFFPYDKEGNPYSKETIFGNTTIAEYLLSNKKVLLKNRTEEQNDEWYLFGRTQALKDVFKDKLAINAVIKDVPSIKINFVPCGSGLYNGLYILSSFSLEKIEDMIKTEEFISYIASLKKYKSGGYYSFSSKDLEQYINYKINFYLKGIKEID